MEEKNNLKYDKYGFLIEDNEVAKQDFFTMNNNANTIDKNNTKNINSLAAKKEVKWDNKYAIRQKELNKYSKKLKRWLRKGIPPKYREKTWMYISGAQELLELNYNEYQKNYN